MLSYCPQYHRSRQCFLRDRWLLKEEIEKEMRGVPCGCEEEEAVPADADGRAAAGCDSVTGR